jgi:NAD(P)-dependent dehydrogenase (short-subunit alcohol dehydrogenase family)
MGIGFATAQSLAAAGYEVVVTGKSAAEIAQTPPADRVRAHMLDVCDSGAIRALLASFERLDALVNCAGTSSRDEFDPEEFARTVEVNLIGTMQVCTAAHELLARNRGAIVNIASMYATFGSPIVPGYASSKGGIVQLTKSLAAAWAQEGIRVNAIAPGWIRTGMARPLWEDSATAAAIAARTPMGRWGEPDECAGVVTFLCSHQARFVTGVTIPVDGGYLVSG